MIKSKNILFDFSAGYFAFCLIFIFCYPFMCKGTSRIFLEGGSFSV